MGLPVADGSENAGLAPPHARAAPAGVSEGYRRGKQQMEMMMMSDEPTRDEVAKLLPCPFCGNDDVLRYDSADASDDWVAIACTNCRTIGPVDYTDPAAIAAWNARHYVSGPLGAEAMKQAAAATVKICRLTDVSTSWTEDDHQASYNDALDDAAASILALPSPSPADLLAAALALPEVRALVDVLTQITNETEGYGNYNTWQRCCDALATIQKGTQ